MKRPRPVRIVTLPGRSVPELREQAALAMAAGADMVEIRIDRLSESSPADLAPLFPSEVPLLATYRSRAEGGEGSDHPEERRRMLDDLVGRGFSAVDREGRRDGPPPAGTKGVVSYHLAALPSRTDLRHLLVAAGPGSWFVKVVAPATLAELIDIVLPALPSPEESSYVVHTTGASGPLLRGWSGRLGMAAVYCSLPARRSRLPSVEPAQIPVDRLRQFQDGPAPGRLFALLGHPVSASASPEIHSKWFDEERQAGLYVPLDVTSESEFEATVRTLADGGFSGVNVTRPWKSTALACSDDSAPNADRAGCANTLVFRAGRVRAENTDVLAVHRRLTELKQEGRWDGGRVTVIGAGGAARASLAASQALGSSATVLARRESEATRIAREFGAESGRWGSPRPTALVVNATPVGLLDGGVLPGIVSDWVLPRGYIVDFVYSPQNPEVARAAAAAGAGYEDGRRLLVYQAAESYRIWWERAIPDASIDRMVAEVQCTV
jgi:shikimate dehydrogenase